MEFGEGLERVGKPVVDETNKEPVDLRTKPEEGTGENADEAESERLKAEGEKETRKEEFLATGKTEAEFDAEELRLEAEKNKTPEQLATEKAESERLKAESDAQTTEALRVKNEMRAEFLKEFGVTSEEELKAKLTPTKPKTAEEIARDAEVYNISVANYAIKELKAFTNDEWIAVNNMRKAPDNELVFHNFADEYKEANKGRLNEEKEADPVTAEEIQDKFNELYHIDSDNKTLKDQGEKNLTLKAKAIREPLETKLSEVKTLYDGDIAQKQAVPEFRTFFQSVLATAIPDKLEYGSGDDKVVFDLGKIDKSALEQLLVAEIGNAEFSDFLKGKGSPEQRARIEKKVTQELLYSFHKDIAKENFKAGESKGKKTAAPGANARFIDPGKREQKQQSVMVTAADDAKVAGRLN